MSSDSNNNQKVYSNINTKLFEKFEKDYFYHLHLSNSNDLKRLFGDVKVVTTFYIRKDNIFKNPNFFFYSLFAWVAKASECIDLPII